MGLNPKVSILLPYRNAEKTIHQCLKSIKNQDFHDWEALLVNDCSCDLSFEIVNSLSQKDPRIRSLQAERPCFVTALNYGISKARSKIIVRMDSDDLMHSNRLSIHFEYLKRNPEVGLVASKVKHISNEESNFNSEGYAEYVKWTNQILSHQQILLNQFRESPFAHPSVSYRKVLVEKYGGYRNGNFPEDYELWLRWLSQGVKMEKVNQTLLDWFDSKERMSRTSTRYSQDAFQKTKSCYLKPWIKQKFGDSKKITAWGCGKVAKKQATYLSENGINITSFYEVDSKKIGQSFLTARILPIDAISGDRDELILVLSGARSAYQKIYNFLSARKLQNGRDFLFIA